MRGRTAGSQLAAKKADGVVLDLFLPPSTIATMVRTVHEASQGRFTGSIAAGVMVSVDHNVRLAMDRVRPILAQYLLEFPELVREIGVDSRHIEDLAAAYTDSGTIAAARLGVSVDVHITANGGPQGVPRQPLDLVVKEALRQLGLNNVRIDEHGP